MTKGLFQHPYCPIPVVGGRGKPRKRLMRADKDGENRQALTLTENLSSYAAFSLPDGKKKLLI